MVGGADDVIAVGGAGTILEFDGDVWKTTPPLTTLDLIGVWGASRDNVWVVGWKSIVLRYSK